MESHAIRLYTVREAAAILKVHERTVLRWIKNGRLAARRIGRQIRIEEHALRTCGEPVSAGGARAQPTGGKQGENGSDQPRKGSPQALMECLGMLTEAEAEMLMEPIRKAHDEDWEELPEIPPRH